MDYERESCFRRLDKAFTCASLYLVLGITLLVVVEALIGFAAIRGGAVFQLGRLRWLKFGELCFLTAAVTAALSLAAITDLRARRGVWDDDDADAGATRVGGLPLHAWWLIMHVAFWLGVSIAWLTTSLPGG